MYCISFYSDFTYYSDATKSLLNPLRPYSGEVKIYMFWNIQSQLCTLKCFILMHVLKAIQFQDGHEILTSMCFMARFLYSN